MFDFNDNSLCDSVLRFNPIQVAEWLQQLLAGKEVFSHKALSLELGVDRTRVQQFLYLFRIPVDLRVRLKGMPGVTEGELRSLRQMDMGRQRVAVERLLGRGNKAIAKVG